MIAEAHRRHGMPSWDLVIVDEAHRSAGRVDKVWTDVHSNVRLPSARRVYMTATPRVLDGDDVVSMDNRALFGERAYRLGFSSARERGLLAGYCTHVVVVTDAQVRATTQARSSQQRPVLPDSRPPGLLASPAYIET